jgi:hypothetical protein
MSNELDQRRRGCKIFFLIVVLLAMPATSQARGGSRRKITAQKAIKVLHKQQAINLDLVSLTRIAQKQQNLQNQLVILSATTDRLVDELNRGFSALTDQMHGLGSSKLKDQDSGQVLMIVESTRRLLRFLTVLLIMLCGASVFLALRLRNGGVAPVDRNPVGPTTGAQVRTAWKGLAEETAHSQLETARFVNLFNMHKEGKI